MLLETFEFPHCIAMSTFLSCKKYLSHSVNVITELKYSFSTKKHSSSIKELMNFKQQCDFCLLFIFRHYFIYFSHNTFINN